MKGQTKLFWPFLNHNGKNDAGWRLFTRQSNLVDKPDQNRFFESPNVTDRPTDMPTTAFRFAQKA